MDGERHTVMASERWQRLKELFAEALILDATGRSRLLDEACADDFELRAELESLLAADREAPSFLETPAAQELGLAQEAAPPSAEGRRLGRYRVLGELGRGGMGVVYRAVRDDGAFHQEVALKLLHSGLESELFASRFRRERQILASLEHPNIARLIDGGADEGGRPYLVMELVEGQPIDVYCRELRLGVTERLELVRTACTAVAFAHAHLVVHCDLKPANVLVTADGTVKLLDFGVARLITPEEDSAASARTSAGWWMTPEYASPEQLRGEPVTTATDIHALGTMLYEMLTGRRLHDLGSCGPDEVLKAVCEREPPRPSQVVARTLPPGAPSPGVSPAGPPETNPKRLRRQLAGDLDTIVLRCLAKDPRRRYGSVVQLSDDLRRHLAGLPIRANPDRLAYRARKFVRRHRAAVAATVLAILSLCGGTIAALQQARLARAERAAAERRFNEVRTLAKTFIFDIHDTVAPLPGSTAVRARIVEIGLEYLERLQREASDDASLQAELAAAFERISAVQGGVGVANLGDRDGAIRSQRRALDLREAVARTRPEDLAAGLALARCHSVLGDLLWEAGDEPGRRQQYSAALAIRSAAAARTPADPAVRRALAGSLWDAAQLEVDDGNLEAGLAGFQRALAEYRAIAELPGTGDGDRRAVALALKKVGAVSSVAGDLQGALVSLEDALTIDRQRLVDDPGRTETMLDVSFDLGDLGFVLLRLGRHRDAVERYEESVALRLAVAESDPEDARARTVLRTARSRLAAALTALVCEGQASPGEAPALLERADSLWTDVEGGGPLDEWASGERQRLRGCYGVAADQRETSPVSKPSANRNTS